MSPGPDGSASSPARPGPQRQLRLTGAPGPLGLAARMRPSAPQLGVASQTFRSPPERQAPPLPRPLPRQPPPRARPSPELRHPHRSKSWAPRPSSPGELPEARTAGSSQGIQCPASQGSPLQRPLPGPDAPAPPLPTPTPQKPSDHTESGRRPPVATASPAVCLRVPRRPPTLLVRAATPTAAFTPQPKLSYLPNPSPLPSLSSFAFPLP